MVTKTLTMEMGMTEKGTQTMKRTGTRLRRRTMQLPENLQIRKEMMRIARRMVVCLEGILKRQLRKRVSWRSLHLSNRSQPRSSYSKEMIQMKEVTSRRKVELRAVKVERTIRKEKAAARKTMDAEFSETTHYLNILIDNYSLSRESYLL